MIFEKEDYIVKARDLNVEIKQNLRDRFKNINYIGISIFIVFTIFLILILLSKNRVANTIEYLGLFLICMAVFIIENKWNLKIKDRIIYINTRDGQYKIKYRDLVCFYAGTRKYKGRPYEKVLVINYLKKNKIKQIIVPYADEFNYEIKQICKSFVTKEEIENGRQIGSDYFDIRDEEQNNYIEKKSGVKIDGIMLLIIALIGSIIACIMILIELYKIIK